MDEFKKTIDEVDAITFMENGIRLFRKDFITLLDDDEIREKLAIKLYNESKKDRYFYFSSLISEFGIRLVLKIYGGDILFKLKDDGRLYVIISEMLSNNVNEVLNYALKDVDFFRKLSEMASYYYSLFYDVDTEIIKRYLTTHLEFATRYFSFDSKQLQILFNDKNNSDEIILGILQNSSCYSSYNQEVVSLFFTTNKRALTIFNKLDQRTILTLINCNIKFSDTILQNDHLIDCIKGASIVNFRKIVNKITFTSGNMDIEEKVYQYYVKLLSSYDSKTGLFLSDEGNDLSKEETSQRISEIVIDYLFKDDIYNVFLNIREILSFNESLDNKVISSDMVDFYKSILMIDKISNEEKIELFYRLKDKKIDQIFYDDISRLREKSYKELQHSVLRLEGSSQDAKLSSKYQVPIYDYREKAFMMLVRVLSTPFNSKTRNARDCYSLISNSHTILFHGPYVYGYTDFDINKILHVNEKDAYSSDARLDSETTDYINRLYRPTDLLGDTIGFNEIQILNNKKDSQYESPRPSYIIALDEITDQIVEESKRLNIPIILIESMRRELTFSPGEKTNSEYSRRMTDSFLPEITERYVSNSGISPYDEELRRKRR